MKLTVRPAREADLAGLLRLWDQTQELHARLQPAFFQAPLATGCTRRQLAAMLASRHQALLVAPARKMLAGLVHVRVFDTPPDPLQVPRRRAYLEHLVVEQELRRRGVGQLLMNAAADWCRRQGAAQLLLSVWAGNETAATFYSALGYRPVSQVLGLDL